MKEYEFEIQVLIKVKHRGCDVDDARRKVCDMLIQGYYNHELSANSVVSDGEKVDEEQNKIVKTEHGGSIKRRKDVRRKW